MSREKQFVVAILALVLSACGNQDSSLPTNQIVTATPLMFMPTSMPDIAKTSESIPTLTLAPEAVLTSNFSLPQGWFLIPEAASSIPSEPVDTNVFKGVKFPPLPDNVFQEFEFITPYGEVPSGTILYQIFLMRQGDTRMLWLGVPFEAGSQSQIYDVIPLPSTQAGDVLIPFICRRHDVMDLFLIVIAAYPPERQPAAEIHYAWRIEPTTITLQPVSQEDIVCSRDWP
jgi:hypothetical protein